MAGDVFGRIAEEPFYGLVRIHDPVRVAIDVVVLPCGVAQRIGHKRQVQSELLAVLRNENIPKGDRYPTFWVQFNSDFLLYS